MNKIEDTNTFEEKEKLIYDAFRRMIDKSEQVIKIMGELCYTYSQKYNSPKDLSLSERQITFLLGEVNKTYGDIDQNLKKINELIKSEETPIKPDVSIREYPEDGHCGRIG